MGARFRFASLIFYGTEFLGRLIYESQSRTRFDFLVFSGLLAENSKHFRVDHLKIRRQKDPVSTL